MSQRLFIGSLALVLVIGGFLITRSQVLATSHDEDETPSPSISASISASASASPASSPTVSPSASVSVSPSASLSPSPTPNASVKYRAFGRVMHLEQRLWAKERKKTAPVEIGKDLDKAQSETDDSASRRPNDPCTTDDGNPAYQWTQYLGQKNVAISNDKGMIRGRNRTKIAESYVISSVFTTLRGDSTRWSDMSMIVQSKSNKNYKLYYRVSDEAGTTDPDDEGWVELKRPKYQDSACHPGKKRVSYSFRARGKYFQYKVHVAGEKENVEKVIFRAQRLKGSGLTTPTPTPTVTPTITPTVSPTVSANPNGEGKLTIITKRLAVKPTATPSAGGALLPTISPQAGATPSAFPQKINPNCFSNQNTEPAADVPISLRQLEGGEKRIEDQQTDEEGLWQGIGGRDSFPVGTYLLKWGDYEKEDYKLVDICIEPSVTVRRTETSVSGDQRATFSINKDQETKVVLLYAPRSKPYIALSKVAVSSKNKVLKSIYPGVGFRYLIRYENTGEVDAKDVVIRDVFAEQFYVQGTENQTIESMRDVRLDVDVQGRTMLTKTIGTVKKGQKGSLIVPVVLRPNAFGSPDDIASQVQINNQPADQVPGTGAGAAGIEPAGAGDLELE